MTDETETLEGQREGSPQQEGYQSSDELVQAQQQIDSLRQENEELKSRLGSLVQKSGTERRDLEENYNNWAKNYQAWATQEIEKRDQIIHELEEKFIDMADAEGAKLVLEERRRREDDERRSREARQEAERIRQSEVDSAIERAVRSFENVSAEELRGVHSADEVWSRAAQIDKEKRDASWQQRLNEVESRTPVAESTSSQDDRDEQERASRTPQGAQTLAAPSRRQDDEYTTRLNELTRELEKAKKQKRTSNGLARVVALRGEIIALKRRYGVRD